MNGEKKRKRERKRERETETEMKRKEGSEDNEKTEMHESKEIEGARKKEEMDEETEVHDSSYHSYEVLYYNDGDRSCDDEGKICDDGVMRGGGYWDDEDDHCDYNGDFCGCCEGEKCKDNEMEYTKYDDDEYNDDEYDDDKEYDEGYEGDDDGVADYIVESDEDEVLPEKEEAMKRLKKVAKLIDILEFVDSCLIVGEKFIRDDDEAREVIKEIREKILSAETVLTDYLITGKMPKIQ